MSAESVPPRGKPLTRLATTLRQDVVAGALLLTAASIAMLWANSPWYQGYHALRETTIGPAALHLELPLATWAADGLLTIFFFVVGVELKREFVTGRLRDPRRAALPIAAAVGGMAAPAAIFALINHDSGAQALAGWAVPTATDIAFAVAVLAIVGSFLPPALRTFLLTLAVVDDLLAVGVIAVFYTDDIAVPALVAAVLPLLAFAAAARRGGGSLWLLPPLACATWLAVHESGVHATIAGVVLGLVVPARRVHRNARPMTDHLEHRLRPLAAGMAAPLFAFFAAGVTVGGIDGLTTATTDSLFLGVVAALVVGKVTGIAGTTFLLAPGLGAGDENRLHPVDVLGVGLLGGIGFTVALLIGELAFDSATAAAHVKVAVLSGSLLSAVLGIAVLSVRNRAYRKTAESTDRTPPELQPTLSTRSP